MESKNSSEKQNFGAMGEKEFLRSLSEKINIPFVDLETSEINPLAIKYVSEKIARGHGVIPIDVTEDTLTVAMSDATDFQAIDDIKITSGKRVVPVLASPQAMQIVLDRFYTNSEQAEQALQNLNDSQEEMETTVDISSIDIDNAPIVRIVNSILLDAVNMGASDIHIEPFEKEIRVRVRIDGDLKTLLTLPKNALSGIVTRIKIMSDLNIAETKRPQDGRVRIALDGKQINMRISFIPAVYGEKIVIRLLNKDSGVIDRSQIGFSPFNMAQVERMLKISEGIILLTGPTGSGKTTTLYALLKDFNTVNRNIITLEDPVEFSMYGINQVQVNSQIGMTFASGLRSILRQDPDIIMLGEIRDEETAQIAIRAAVTGHIVLSTLHTNDTASSITRLTDMGIPKYMVTSAVAGIVAQRLLKKVCTHCAEQYQATEREKELLGVQGDIMLTRGRGCPYCNQTGFRGRTAIHEVLVLDQEIRRMINDNHSTDEIKAHACKKGMKTLAESARELALSGDTTVGQAVKATYSLD